MKQGSIWYANLKSRLINKIGKISSEKLSAIKTGLQEILTY